MGLLRSATLPNLPAPESEILSFQLLALQIPSFLSKSLQDSLAVSREGPLASPIPLSTPILRRSQWRCLARSYLAVCDALRERFYRACSTLKERPAREIMCKKLILLLQDLHEAVEEGKRCMEKSQMPAIKSSKSLLAWLAEMVLKEGMSTDVVDVHLQRLLWTSWAVDDLLSKSAPDLESTVPEEHTRKLCGIWEEMDAVGDFRSAQEMMERIKLGEGETSSYWQTLQKQITRKDRRKCRQFASFFLEKVKWFSESSHRITENAGDLPGFLWVDSKGLKGRPKLVGEGSNGKVFDCTWLGYRCTVKELPFVADDTIFRREATIQAQVHHPNVLSLVCLAEDKSKRKHRLVMELMDQNLQQLIVQRMNDKNNTDPPFSLQQSVDLMLQIAQGMEYLHNNNIMHRDLKSRNILVSTLSGKDRSAGNIGSHVHLKIADFGLSKAKNESTTYTSKPIGTTPWMAPEVLNAEDGLKYRKNADVYSFAVVCYEILAGKIPFEGEHNIKERVVVRGERPVLPVMKCPRALSSYIEQCWHAEADQRPSFTQICRLLRYFKVCISYEKDHGHSWFLYPLSTTICDRIDTMIQMQWKQFGVSHPQVPHMLAILVEMYCCREVLASEEHSITPTISRSKSLSVDVVDQKAGPVVQERDQSFLFCR